MTRLPAPSWYTFWVLLVIVLDLAGAPVGRAAGVAGADVVEPVAVLTPVLAAPLKSSAKTCVQPDGTGGTEADALWAAATVAPARANTDAAMRSRRLCDVSLSWMRFLRMIRACV
jgi:hypothetical protein